MWQRPILNEKDEVKEIVSIIKDITELSYSIERQKLLTDIINKLDDIVWIKKLDPEEKFEFSSDKQINHEHHQCWKKMEGVITCRERKNFIPDCQKLMRLADDTVLREKIKESVKYVVYNDSKSYSVRLLNCVNNILGDGYNVS